MALHAPFSWTSSAPLVAPMTRDGDVAISVKDPTLVEHDGRWHMFCSVRSRTRTHQIEHISSDRLDDWSGADRALLTCVDGYFCAPQVFYFRPHGLWYLVYQTHAEGRRLGLQPTYSTTRDISDPASWTAPSLFYTDDSLPTVEGWIDFWVICDDARAHLFFTSLDGRMWRASTELAAFPQGFGDAECVISDAHADWRLFEASHTYRVAEDDTYLTLVEGEDRRQGVKRYFMAYAADTLAGEWSPIATTPAEPFAGAANVAFAAETWSDHISHGEFVRQSGDETLTVSLADLRMVYQGVHHEEFAGRRYGDIPWRIGLLRRDR
ncbi:glycoside hydrolase [Candidatus Poribacteria bacterium]|jgi:hypothetical protein|nr:glycoside hydrolase [Candidatus Poribacteria bacterium]MBT7099345.1 glycoside hydrolase [Candidatus Poribacteria bacterium]MBT7804675.1 glycoside hydrolase [Candidatus Poribacteria bacterium]